MSLHKNSISHKEISERLQKDVDAILGLVDLKSFEERHSVRDDIHLDIDKILTMSLTELNETVSEKPVAEASPSRPLIQDFVEDTTAEIFYRPAPKKFHQKLIEKSFTRVNEVLYTFVKRLEF